MIVKYCKDCKYCIQYYWRDDAECKKSKENKQTESAVSGIYKYVVFEKCETYRSSGKCGREAIFFIHKNIFIRIYHLLTKAYK